MQENKQPLNVLMIGPGRKVMGGISTVVNSYYDLGLDKQVNLKYISTMEDGNKIKKLTVAMLAFIRFKHCVNKFDIVHVHMAAQASFSRKRIFIKEAKKAKKKIIIHQHAADFDIFFKDANDYKKKEIKNTFAMADKVVVLSEEWADYYARNICDADKVIIIHNGVILPDYEKNDYSDHNVLFLGRLGKRKGSYDLLKAIPGIIKVIPDAKFYFGGDGDIEQSKKIIEENNLSENVKLLGWLQAKEKEKYLKKCSIFILPSYNEGMPMSVLEAMSYGLATVSTNTGGIPQIIQNYENGIRINAGDIDAIEKTLILLLDSDEEKKKLGKRARLTVKDNFGAKTALDSVVRIYNTV